VLDAHFAADDQGQIMLFGRLPSAHDAGQRALVGDCQGAVAETGGTLEQFRRAGCAALEAEIRQAMQLGVVAHANHPWSISDPSPPARKAQLRWPARVSIR